MEPETRPRTNLFFRLTAVAAALFAMTVLALTSIMFGDARAPIHAFLSRHGGTLIAGEVAVALSCGLLGLAVDRRRIVENSAHLAATSDVGPTPAHSITEAATHSETVAGGDAS